MSSNPFIPRTSLRQPQRAFAFYGKGGAGKSTIVANLATLWSLEGRKVLVVGCDPKHDTSQKLRDQVVPTVLAQYEAKRGRLTRQDILFQGRHGIDFLEAGGPEPGVGCAGRGIAITFELMSSCGVDPAAYDVALYDVLGDVVCGGFAVPMRDAASRVVIVTSGEVMSLYAANNICRAVVRYSNRGVRLVGLVGNLRGLDKEVELVHAFAQRVGTTVLGLIPRDPKIQEAEIKRRTVVEEFPDAPAAGALKSLANKLWDAGNGGVPRPMGDVGLEEFFRSLLPRY